MYLPPADRHLQVEGGCLRWDRGEPVCRQRPSGTVLFQSMARSLGSGRPRRAAHRHGRGRRRRAAGAAGAGGYTIAEDESTAVVYGMPAAAVRLGAVCDLLPLPEIAPQILRLVSPGKGRR